MMEMGMFGIARVGWDVYFLLGMYAWFRVGSWEWRRDVMYGWLMQWGVCRGMMV